MPSSTERQPPLVRRLRLGPRLLLLYGAPTLAMVALVAVLAVPVVREWRAIAAFEKSIAAVADEQQTLRSIGEERVGAITFRFSSDADADLTELERRARAVDQELADLGAPAAVVTALDGPRNAAEARVAVPEFAWSEAADWVLGSIADSLADAPTDDLQRRATAVTRLAAMVEYADRESVIVYVPFAEGATSMSAELAADASAIHERELVLVGQVEAEAGPALIEALRVISFDPQWSSVVLQRNDLLAGRSVDADQWLDATQNRVSLINAVLNEEISLLAADAGSARQAQATRALLALAGVVVASVAIGGSFVFLRRSLLYPISSMTDVARNLARGEVSVRESSGADELAELEGQFAEVNRVLDELDRETGRVTAAVAFGDHDARFEIRPGGVWGRLVDGLNDALDRMSGAMDEASASDRRWREAQTTARRLETHDSVTGLLNRAGLQAEADRRDGLVGHRGRWAVAIVPHSLDMLDRAHGAGAAAEAVAVLASRIDSAVAEECIVGHLSDREFVVLGFGDHEFPAVLDRLVAVLADPVGVRNTTYLAPSAIGHARSQSDDGDLIADAATAATVAMHEAMTDPLPFDPSMRDRARRSIELRRWLAGAVDRDDLEVWYQPILDVGSGLIVGHEALVRGRREGRIVSPVDFIATAESTGTIGAIGRFVVDRANRDRTALVGDHGSIAVNVSPSELATDELVTSISRALRDHDTPPQLLTVEITESLLVSDQADVAARLFALRDLGIELAIDDFGTGYSSLDYLRRLPFTIVKLDRSIVAGLDVDTSAASVVRRTIELAHDLGMIVVAEGVERETELEQLKSFGCDRVQGWLIGRPAPLEVRNGVASAGSAQSRIGR